MKKKVDLQLAIAQFARIHRRYSTPEGAVNCCCEASGSFLDYLAERGLDIKHKAKEYTFHVETRKNPRPSRYRLKGNVSNYHCIVRTKEFFIDWTARQYNSSLPFPYIIPRKQRRAQ